jgi:COP9 signalosome complex subunit 7
MDQTQQKALNALEPYLALSKSATSPRAACDLISQATSNPHTYVFAELLQTPNIQALSTGTPEHRAFLALLEIFAWGTWEDYNSTFSPARRVVPTLTSPQKPPPSRR